MSVISPERRQLRIGSLTLDVPFYQAALSGYTDRAMRLLAKRFGSPLSFTGVLLDKIALHPKAVKTLQFLPDDDEHPVGAQVLGSDPATMAAAAAAFANSGFDLIDLNFACPAPKVLRRGRGGFLMKHPAVVAEALERTRNAVKCPVMIKLRIGYDDSEYSRENFWDICHRIAAIGPDAVCIHGRTVEKLYRGKADWSIITEVKRQYPHLTIIGSGDVMTAETVVERLTTSGLDGAVIARGAVGNPWIFRDARVLVEGKPLPPSPTLAEQAEIILDHIRMVLQLKPERKGLMYFRKFTANYARLHPNRKTVQLDLMAAKTRAQLEQAIHKHYLYNK